MRRGSPWFISASVLLVAVSGTGLWNGSREWPGETGLQRLAALTEMGYGLAGLAAAAALWTGHSRTRPLLAAWAILITVTGGLAPVAWGDAPLWSGALAAVLSAAVAGIVVWLALRALRPATRV